MLKSTLKAGLLGAIFAAGAATTATAETKTVVVAGGCFWCVESDFDKVKGVTATTSGFAGGTSPNPTYKSHAGHYEVVKIDYDSDVTDYKTLVTTFLRTIDPTDGGGQFCDRGMTYAPALFASTPEEKAAAEAALADASAQLGKKLPVPVKGAPNFTAAEDFHQNYYRSQENQLTRFGLIKRADAYKKYRAACGRDETVKKVWGNAAYQGVAGHGS
ncbi:peptide-methionine (S)-S-oxide reductase MsrA [Ahrensia sp. 13_GOM-1096m]|uniref:peptide-methionine (S)-S-oxide reductase MsrA n=1 Tax=Ahrensia sp. 13_GOM-1096m TaxID=1380380 RepID=UPI000478D5A3|nr:peptide-methionine (S)-S-oxide reductase MsrA [Ahrensia sp. 13_GOM-1096m]